MGPPGDVPFHRVLGDGPTVMVAGGIHFDHSYLRPWLDPIAESARLVYFDHRGTGRSGTRGDPSALSHDLWVEDIEKVRMAVGAQRMVLLGHSYGGFLAQEYALAHGDRLDGLILCSTAPAMDYPGVIMANASASGSSEIVEAAQLAFGTPVAGDGELRRLWRILLPLYFHSYDPAVAEEMDRRARYSAAAFNRAFFECLPGFDMVGKLDRIRAPTLLLAGRHDWICPPEQGIARLHGEMIEAEFATFNDSGHFPFIEEQERFTTIVVDWLKTLTGG